MALKAFTSHSSELHEALNDGVILRLTWDLVQDHMLSKINVEMITNVSLSIPEKATKLVSTLMRVIESDSNNLVKILKRCSEYHELEPIAERIHNDYDKLGTSQIHPRKILESVQSITSSAQSYWSKFFICKCTSTRVLFVAVSFLVLFASLMLIYSNYESIDVQTKIGDHISQQADADELNFTSSFPLPSRSDHFTGRNDITERVIKLLALGSRTYTFVGLFGPPGIGKSSLAIHIGHEIMIRRKLGVHYVDLSEFQLSRDQQVKHRPAQSKLYNFESILSTTFNGENVLNWALKIEEISILVLDNCDSVLDNMNNDNDFQMFLFDLTKASHNNLKVLITSEAKISIVPHFTAVEVVQLSTNESLSLIQMIKPELAVDASELIASLADNNPLFIKLALASEGINDIGNISMLSSFSKKELFDLLMGVACKHLSNNTKIAAYLLSLFPSSFDKSVTLFQGFKIFHKEIAILLEHSFLQSYSYSSFHSQIAVERYKFHKLIQEYFRNKLLKNKSLKKIVVGIFRKNFVRYYQDFFYQQLISMKSLSEPSQDEHLFLITEQHNLRHLATLISTEKDLENSFEEDVVTIYSLMHGLLPNNESTRSSILKRVMTSYSEKNMAFGVICSFTYLNINCEKFYSDFLLSTLVNSDTDYAHFPCSIWDIVSAPNDLDFITDDFVRLLLSKSFAYCSFNNMTYVFAKLYLYKRFIWLWWSCLLKYTNIMKGIDFKDNAQSAHILAYVFLFPLLQYLIRYSPLLFYPALLLSIIVWLFFNAHHQYFLTRHDLVLLVLFFWIFYYNNWAWNVVDNAWTYFSLEGGGLILFKQWCYFCVHFTYFTIIRCLNNFICFLFLPGILIYFLVIVCNAFSINFMEKIGKTVRLNYRLQSFNVTRSNRNIILQ